MFIYVCVCIFPSIHVVHFTHMKINESRFCCDVYDFVGNMTYFHARIIRPISSQHVVREHFDVSAQRVSVCVCLCASECSVSSTHHRRRSKGKTKHNSKRYNLFWQQVKNEIKAYNLFKLIFKSIFASFFVADTVHSRHLCALVLYACVCVVRCHILPVHIQRADRLQKRHQHQWEQQVRRKKNLYHAE